MEKRVQKVHGQWDWPKIRFLFQLTIHRPDNLGRYLALMSSRHIFYLFFRRPKLVSLNVIEEVYLKALLDKWKHFKILFDWKLKMGLVIDQYDSPYPLPDLSPPSILKKKCGWVPPPPAPLQLLLQVCMRYMYMSDHCWPVPSARPFYFLFEHNTNSQSQLLYKKSNIIRSREWAVSEVTCKIWRA